jgi:hypothetical protein
MSGVYQPTKTHRMVIIWRFLNLCLSRHFTLPTKSNCLTVKKMFFNVLKIFFNIRIL